MKINGLISELKNNLTGMKIKITILARRPRGLRAKINLASKEMSVFVVQVKMSRGKKGGSYLCFSKPLTRVF